jgi:hypothetical protein
LLTPLRRALALAVGLVAVTALPAHAQGPTADQIVGNIVTHGALYVISIQQLEAEAVAFVLAVQAQEAEQARQEALRATQRPAVVSQPSGSYAALANCEQGGRNHPYFGYFSIMDGSAGGKSWDEQVAMVQAIKSRAGAGAWDGCARYVP